MKREKGLTLIELLITLMLIAVLSLIAMPKFKDHSLRAHRVDARNKLLEISQKMQLSYMLSKKYTDIDLAKQQLDKSPSSGETRYTITLELDADTVKTIDNKTVNFGAQGYKLTATAVGKQEKDKCLTITLDSRGVKGGTMPNECWR